MNIKQKLITVVGSTASGKTSLAISLCKKFNGEVISADSRQIYKEMDIGTAKIKGAAKEIDGEVALIYEGVPHYLIDIITPDDPDYSVANFKRDTERIIEKITKKGKIPFLVGGTGLYVQAVVDGLDIPAVKPDFELRAKIEKDIDEKGLDKVVEELKKECPNLCAAVDFANLRRVVRATEICKKVGDISKEKTETPYEVLQLGVKQERAVLYERINKRVGEMIERGLEDECKLLFVKYDENLPSLSGIGYRQMNRYFKEEISKEEAIELIKRDSRRYAKRQMTWFKRDLRINWVADYEEAEKLLRVFLNR